MQFRYCDVIKNDVVVFYDVEGYAKSVLVNDIEHRTPCPEFDQDTMACKKLTMQSISALTAKSPLQCQCEEYSVQCKFNSKT